LDLPWSIRCNAKAEVVYRIAASCYDYGTGYGPLDLGDGYEFFPIPEMTADGQSLSGIEKLTWFTWRVYALFKREKDARNLPPTLPGEDLENQQHRSQNLQLQVSVLHERQQKEHLTCQLHQLLHSRQQVQEPTAQDLELQLQYLQQQRREAEPLLWEDFLRLLDAEPKPEWIDKSINSGGTSNQYMKSR
jgi:hypothetical protein